MNRQDIIDMIAKVYGVAWTSEAQLKDLERFAALVASAEREACAKLCEDAPEPDGADLAERIRARGNVATNDTSQERVDKTSEIVHEAQRTWVGLTDVLDFIEEFTGAERERHPMFSDGYDLALSHVKELVEAKLKEKNSA